MQNPFLRKGSLGSHIPGEYTGLKGERSFNPEKTSIGTMDDYPCRLTMYEKPPPSEISMEEFETFAIDRLQGT